MQPVVMEAAMCDQTLWAGGNLATLRKAMFIDYCDDTKVDEAAKRIVKKVKSARTLGRNPGLIA